MSGYTWKSSPDCSSIGMELYRRLFTYYGEPKVETIGPDQLAGIDKFLYHNNFLSACSLQLRFGNGRITHRVILNEKES